MADTGKDFISNSADPKSIQDLTSFVSDIYSSFSAFNYRAVIGTDTFFI